MCYGFNIEQHFTSPYTLRSNGKMENFNKFLKASIRKLCQEDTVAWDQVLDQLLFSYRCCPHTSTGKTPCTFLYNRDPPLPVQKLIRLLNLIRVKAGWGRGSNNHRSLFPLQPKCWGGCRQNRKDTTSIGEPPTSIK